EPGLPQPGDVVAGKYRVERALGAGGMGAVYRATHTVSGQAVALKWLRPKLAAEPRAALRLIREAQASARIRHPNVVDIYGVEEQDGKAFLVFELLEGETLREVLRRGQLGVEECLALLLPALRGVAAAHAQGVVHRDIKPENLFVTRDPDDPTRAIPKVLDFGISKLAADSPLVEGTLTATGATLGTPHYMSLEQLQGAEIDSRTDVYAFGVVLYECLTGRRPFESDSFAAIVVKAATETPLDPRLLRPELPAALCAVVLRAMARTREDRYPSVLALIDALLPFATAARSPTQAQPSAELQPATSAERAAPTRSSARGERSTPTPPTPTSPTPRTRWAFAAGTLLVAVGAGSWLWSAWPSSSQLKSASPVNAPTSAPAAEREPASAAESSPSAAGAPARGVGADEPPPERSPKPSKFTSGWVYLGEHASGTWNRRYFDGWSGDLPARGAKLKARGRSYVRAALPDLTGALAEIRTTLGPDNRVELLELARWQGGRYVWARVRPAP
ncbi:MAG TPA: serine/threonine-protein kinase, partial [Polyangiales bacterium]|nr:serine/threonine-protein kinase [Polyangiales bacterium]